ATSQILETWRKTYGPELAKLQESSNDSGSSGRQNPSPLPQSYASILSVVIPTATYACETWMKTASITNKLDDFHRRCLRSILKISWRDHITDEEVMRSAGVAPLSDIVSDRRERKTGHGLRLPRERLARVAIEGVQRRHGDKQPRKT
ncbi:hypothetical protein Bbelb_371200, partial [Xyrichtys novacula]